MRPDEVSMSELGRLRGVFLIYSVFIFYVSYITGTTSWRVSYI